jgi:hypothetical protein
MNLNLIFAVAWLIVAALIFVLRPEQLSLRIGGIPFSAGWVALVLALYNMARWWSTRSARRQRAAEREALAQRFRRHRNEERQEPVEPDPNFNFGEPPPSQGGAPPPG